MLRPGNNGSANRGESSGVLPDRLAAVVASLDQGLGYRYRALGAGENGYATHLHNAHKYQGLEVCYRWHPWFGRKIRGLGSIKKNGRVFLRSICEEAAEQIAFDLPEWMFSESICRNCRLSSEPCVSPAALANLRHLISSTKPIIDRHYYLEGGGGMMPQT